MKIRVIITGGTIDGMDKESYPSEEKYTYVPGLLKTIGVDYPYDILMIKDSSLLTYDDREAIAERCKDSPEDRLVITHGTDTMTKTAKFLDGLVLDKTVVLTGSFIPADKPDSDAIDNMRTALYAAESLPPNVYIAMNGKVFNANNVKKDFEKKIFEPER
jgi:L-asparaginase